VSRSSSQRTSLPALVRWLDDLDTALASRGESVQVTYDHLDKLGQTNPALRERYVLSLLALWLSLSNRYTRVRPKVFLREDLFDRARQTPDGSKLETRSIRLEWNREDLFRVLLRHLGTDDELKAWTDAWPQPLSWVHDEVLGWMPPDALPEEGPVSQKGVAEQIVDAVMGAGTKKGYTHRWIPNHLQDARGSIVPRSIVNLFAFAAEYASENGPKAIGAHLLRPFELQAGLEKTSLYRVAELKEEHRVVGRVLPSLGILLCQAGRSQCVRADEEVGNHVLPLSALAPVGVPEVAGETGAGLVEWVEPDPCRSEVLANPVRLAERGPSLAPYNRADHENARGVGCYEGGKRAVPVQEVLEEDVEQDGRIDRRDHSPSRSFDQAGPREVASQRSTSTPRRSPRPTRLRIGSSATAREATSVPCRSSNTSTVPAVSPSRARSFFGIVTCPFSLTCQAWAASVRAEAPGGSPGGPPKRPGATVRSPVLDTSAAIAGSLRTRPSTPRLPGPSTCPF